MYQLKQSRNHQELTKFKNLLLWRKHWNKPPNKLTIKEWLLSKNQAKLQLQALHKKQLHLLVQLKAKPYKHLRNNKLLNKRTFLINLLMKRNKDKLKSSKTKNLRKRLLMLRKKDKMKKFFQNKEPKNSRFYKRKKQPRNLKPKRWNKNSCLHKLFKRPKLLLPKKLLPKPTWLDWRESMNFLEERLRLNYKC